MKFSISALAILGFIFLGNVDPVSAQAPQEKDSVFVSALGGAWKNQGNFYGAAWASAAAKPSEQIFVEVGGSILWRPEPNGDVTPRHTVRFGGFREFPSRISTARPFFGVGLEFWLGDLEGGSLTGHLGVRQRLAGDLGLRLEAVGKAGVWLGSTTYELLAGLYFKL